MNNDKKSIRLLRMLLYLMGSYPKPMEECIQFLGIRKSAFYNYRNELMEVGFNVKHKEGKYWIEAPDTMSPLLANLLHFSEEEAYILARSIDAIDGNSQTALRLKQKLVAFLNQDQAVDAYLRKEKTEIVNTISRAIRNKKQVLLKDYASGHSLSVTNRTVEPFEFNHDFNLVYAYDTARKENLQFKVCRIGDVYETLLPWKHERKHRSAPVDVFRNSGNLDKEVHIGMNLRAYNLLTEEYPLSDKYISKMPSNRYILKAPVAIYEGPGRFVLGMAEDIELMGDEGFAGFIQKKLIKYKNIFKTPRKVESE